MARGWHTIPGRYYEYRCKYETFDLNTRRYFLILNAFGQVCQSWPCHCQACFHACLTWICLLTILVSYYEYLCMYVTFDLTTRRYFFPSAIESFRCVSQVCQSYPHWESGGMAMSGTCCNQ